MAFSIMTPRFTVSMLSNSTTSFHLNPRLGEHVVDSLASREVRLEGDKTLPGYGFQIKLTPASREDDSADK